MLLFFCFSIMLLNLLNLYSLIFALFSKIEGMSLELDSLKPTLTLNATLIANETFSLNESFAASLPDSCVEQEVSCGPCDIQVTLPMKIEDGILIKAAATSPFSQNIKKITPKILLRRPRDEKLDGNILKTVETTTLNSIMLGLRELERLRGIRNQQHVSEQDYRNTASDSEDYDYTFYDTESTTNNGNTDTSFDYSNKDYSTTITDDSSIDFISTDYIFSTEDLTITEKEESTESPLPSMFSSDADTSEGAYTTYNNTTFETEEYYSTVNVEVTNPKGVEVTDKTTGFDTTTDVSVSPSIYDENYVTTEELTTEFITTFSSDLIDSTEFLDTTTDQLTTSTEKDLIEDTNKFIFTSTTPFLAKATFNYNTDVDLFETSSPYSQTQASATARNYDRATETSTGPAIATTIQNKHATKADFCPDFSFNCTVTCNGKSVKQVFFMSNCTIIRRICYVKNCTLRANTVADTKNGTNATAIDLVFVDKNNRKMYNLSVPTKKKLLKLCWETMFGQELVKLTMMDLVCVVSMLLL